MVMGFFGRAKPDAGSQGQISETRELFRVDKYFDGPTAGKSMTALIRDVMNVLPAEQKGEFFSGIMLEQEVFDAHVVRVRVGDTEARKVLERATYLDDISPDVARARGQLLGLAADADWPSVAQAADALAKAVFSGIAQTLRDVYPSSSASPQATP
jgi:hypothetical protein